MCFTFRIGRIIPIAPIAIVLFQKKNAVYKSLVRAKPRSPKPIALTVRVELFALLKVHLTVLSANNAETSCLTVIKNDFEIVKMLIEAGADAVKVGIGPGSICTTRLVAGIGVPQLSAILSARKGIGNKNVTLIADGGIKFSGDIPKALAAGADAVMIGSLFAGTSESPGKIIKKNGKYFKSFRGMGSIGAMNKGSADRYFQAKQKDTSKYVPEGVEGLVKYKGPVDKIIFQLIGGLKSSMGYLGSKKVKNLRIKPKFVKITKAGFYESMVHSVETIKSSPNFKL